MSRILGTLLFVVVVFVVTDCHAQRHRGLFRRGLSVQPMQVQNDQASDPIPDDISPNGNQVIADGATTLPKQHLVAPRYFAPRTQRYYDIEAAYPKYYGGFHSSFFSTTGVPSGDIGFRGNGIYWTPW